MNDNMQILYPLYNVQCTGTAFFALVTRNVKPRKSCHLFGSVLYVVNLYFAEISMLA